MTAPFEALNRLLLDEHIPIAVARGLINRVPAIAIQVLRVGDAGAPPLGTPDGEILRWIEAHAYLLVTNNRATMPGHLRDHLASGRRIPGILLVSRPLSIGEIIDEITFICDAGRPSDFENLIIYLPLS